MSVLDKSYHKGLSYREWMAVEKLALVICEVGGCVQNVGGRPEPCAPRLKAAEECLRTCLLKPCSHDHTEPYRMSGVTWRHCLDCDTYAIDMYMGGTGERF